MQKAKRKSRVNPAKLQSHCHAVNGQHIGGNAVVDVVEFGIANDLVESALHDVQKTFVDFTLTPEESLAVLNPFEIADGNAAGVSKNVWNGEDALGIDDGIGLPSCGAVGGWPWQTALTSGRIL